MIKVEDICKYYASKKAIENISFQIKSGEIIGLLGLNGAGKSTILKILGCHLLPSHGTAYVDGYSVEEQPGEVRRLIGFLPDTPPLYDEMTVENYLKFVAGLRDVPRARLSERLSFIMSKTNIEDVAKAALNSLSHGYRQRVGIAQALIHDPKVLILDEPILGLDPIQIIEMRDLIIALRGEHTVILSSHILSEITKTCDRILVVDQGSLVAEGTAKELSDSLTGKMRIQVKWAGSSDEIVAKIKNLDGVTELTEESEDRQTELTIDTSADLRSELAKIVVESGGELLKLQKVELGLESLFLKLVQAK